MAWENDAAGLRERLYLARLFHRDLRAALDADLERPRLLALRAGVLFHLYATLSGLLRQSARAYGVAGPEQCLGLDGIIAAFSRSETRVPEASLIHSALADPADPVHWLEERIQELFDARGLGRRPRPREDALSVSLEEPGQELDEQDMARLADSVERVAGIVDEAYRYMQEW